MEKRKIQKAALFQQLYRLDDPEEEPEGFDQIDFILRYSKSTNHSSENIVQPLNLRHHLGRTTSAPLPLVPSLGTNEVPIVHENPCTPAISTVDLLHEQVMADGHVISCGGSSGTTRKELPKLKGKRKRGLSLEIIPESQQIFRGLTFCKSTVYFQVSPQKAKISGRLYPQ